MINMQTKFEVSLFTRYEEVEGSTKCRILASLGIRGHPRSPECHHSIKRIRLPI